MARFDSLHLRDSRGRAGEYSTVIEVVVVVVIVLNGRSEIIAESLAATPRLCPGR